MNRLRFMVGVLAIALVALAPQIGWTQSSATGQIFGTCEGPDGAVMPGVVIQVKNQDTGFNRGTVSDASGFFRIDLLPSGIYDVRADLTGFKSEIKRGVEVTLGSSIKVQFTLAISAVEEEIVVTAEAPVIETTNPSVSASVSDSAIANLPLNGRDFTDFVVLTPGAVAADATQGGGRGGINIGARGIQNSFNIDGSNDQSSFFGEERGGTRPPFTFSQSAIKEMQVIRNSYNLEFSAGGGIINAITKSGTNQLRGEVFGYYRDESTTQADARGFEPDAFEQLQYGFSLGGPIVKDKLHFFVGVDTQDFQIPSFRGFDDFQDAWIPQWEALTGLDYGQEVGDIGQTNDALVFMVKFDWQVSNNHLLSLRDNWSSQEGVNLTNGYFSSGRSTNGLEENSFNSLVLTANSVLSENWFNEAIVQYSAEERPRTANTTAIPEAQIGFSYDAVFGQNNFLPNFLDENRIQLIDNLTYYAGDHTLKGGINFDFVTFDDGFFRYGGGANLYLDWDGFFNNNPFRYTQSFSDSNGTVKFDTDYYALYLQDEWRTSPNFTLTYGLRWELQKHGQPPDTNPLYPDTGQIPNDKNNWSPRVGFAWDLSGDGKSVLRGGGGYFYDNTPTLLDANAMLTNGVRVIRVTLDCFDGDPCPDWPNRIPSLGALPGATPDIFVFDRNFENPETLRFSLGYEREVARDLALGADLIYSKTKKLQRKQDQNLEVVPGELTPVGNPVYEDGNVFPDFDQVIQFTSDVRQDYQAAVLFIRKRFSHRWALDANYTYGKSKDNDSNERSVSSSSSFPMDQYNLDIDWGYSNFDIRHKFVASFMYQLPWNFMVSAIGSVRSGFPYSAMDQRDINGDSYNRNERAMIEDNGTFFQYGRNTFRQPSNKNLDLRLSWTANFSSRMSLELILDMFNVTNQANWYTTRTRLVSWNGSLTSDFGDLNRVGDPRNWQFGVKFRF
ncbi:MAG: TonB-dependent receptor domain-containing protein [Thermoanaerobaculales bacterium]